MRPDDGAPRTAQATGAGTGRPLDPLPATLDGHRLMRYTGGSMWPTLRSGDLLDVADLAFELIRPGHVVVFRAGGSDDPIVHRVGRVAPGALFTRGDAARFYDPWIVRAADVDAVVMAAGRGRRRRPLRAGRPALIAARARSRLLRPLWRVAADVPGLGSLGRAAGAALRRLPLARFEASPGSPRRRLVVAGRCLVEHDEARDRWRVCGLLLPLSQAARGRRRP